MNTKDIRNKSTVQALLKQGAVSEFWKVITESLQDTIDHLKEQMDSDELSDLPAAEYKVQNEILRHKIKYLELLKATPETLALWLETPEEERTNFDPYRTAKDFVDR